MKESHEIDHDTPLQNIEDDAGESLSPQALGKFLLDETFTYIEPTNEEDQSGLEELVQGTNKLQTEMLLRGESVQQRTNRVRASENPLLEAVQPLLRALSDMPEHVATVEHVEILKKSLKNEINIFTVVCEEADISWKKMAIVRYCICTALDESAHAKSWGVAAAWSRSNLLNHFEGDNDGGNKFFLLVGRLSMNSHEYADVLEILLRILGLGFEGRYSIVEDGDRQLNKIRQRLLSIVQSTKEATQGALSPHGILTRKRNNKFSIYIPVRTSLLTSGILLSAMFIWSKYHLIVNEQAINDKLLKLQKVKNNKLPPLQRLRLTILLKEEILKNLVKVYESSNQSKVIFTGDSMFMAGSEHIRPEMLDILKRMAKEVHRVNGRVVIVGHTDATPVHNVRFPNNQVLSEKRAINVSQYFLNEGIVKEKIKAEGVGATKPISSNDDKQGRAQNRRVEIFVTY